MNLFKQLMNDVQELKRAARSRPTTSTVLASDRFQILVVQRLREQARTLRIPVVNHVLRRLTTVVFGLEIGNDVTLGTGVTFVHPIANVVGGDAVLGARVIVMGNVTVGTAKDNGYPVIDDDVVLGAGCRVLGPIHVGKGAIIGANAVVVRDVPPGAVVTGVPGVTHEHRKGLASVEPSAQA